MVRTIDKINGVAVQKVTKPDGSVLRYQTIPLGDIGKTQAEPHTALWAARAYAQAQPAEVSA